MLVSKDVLWAWRAGAAMGHLTYSRASAAHRMQRTGTFKSEASGTPRLDWKDIDSDENRERYGYLSEGARTVENSDSMDFSAAGNWSDGGGGNWTITTKTSVLDGQTAYQHENAGGTNQRLMDVGTLTGSPETFHIIVEDIDSTDTYFGFYDNTAGNWVARARFVWATESISVANENLGSSVSAYVVEDMGIGPNGGAMFWLAITGTPDNSGNNRRLYIFPNLVSGEGLILHYAGHEEAAFPSSPIDTNSGSASRSADAATDALNSGVHNDGTLYGRIYRPVYADLSGDIGIGPGIVSLSASVPRVYVEFDQTARNIKGVIDTATTDQNVTGSIPSGDVIEWALQYRNLKTGGSIRLDVGSGYGSWSSAATGFASFGDSTIQILDAVSPMFGTGEMLKHADGHKTLTEMQNLYTIYGL